MSVDQRDLLIHDTAVQHSEASTSKQESKQDGKSTQHFQSGKEANTIQRAHVDCKSAQQVEQPAAGWIFTQREITIGGDCICMLTSKAASR